LADFLSFLLLASLYLLAFGIFIFAIGFGILSAIGNALEDIVPPQANSFLLSNLKELLNKSECKKTPLDYRIQFIPKKTGGKRRLQIPNKALMQLQKQIDTLLRNNLSNFVHSHAHAFRENRSIKTNALPHVNQAVVIKLDIKDFFENVSKNHLDAFFKAETDIDEETLSVLYEIVLSDYGLPQGSPTSPFLSNLIFYKIDEEIRRLARSVKANYTRYADDMTFSISNDDKKSIGTIIYGVSSILEKNNLKINKKKGKLQVLRKHQAQRVCGITVNSDRTTISRKQRRLIRASRHNLQNGKKSSFTENQLKGWESFIDYTCKENLFFDSGKSDCVWCIYKEKPFRRGQVVKCPICEFTTNQPSKMKEHWLTHNDEQALELVQCCKYHKKYFNL